MRPESLSAVRPDKGGFLTSAMQPVADASRPLFAASRRRIRENERFAMSGEQCVLALLWHEGLIVGYGGVLARYLEKHHVRDYLEDVIKLLLECRDDNPVGYIHRCITYPLRSFCQQKR